ncbi:nitrite reductase, partial [Sulfolobus sp. A20-N-G8]
SEEGKVGEFQIYVGGSLGENNTNPSFSALALPLGTVKESELIKTLDAIVKIQAEWGDRKNRHWARFKYVVYMQGIEWIRRKIKEYSGVEIGPIKNIHLVKDLHLGWYTLNDKWAFGMFIENGRVIDGRNGKIKSIIRYIADNFEDVKFYTTSNQHLIIAEIYDEEKERIDKIIGDLN